jgi:diaminopimelate epimerase
MKIPFFKMHGAGNDFIVVDDRAGTFPAADAEWIRRITDRRLGVGSDGVLLMQPSDTADFRMRFFNPDGGEAEMCGNGARCAARLAAEIGAAPPRLTIETGTGTIRAEVRDENVKLHMTDPRDWRLGRSVEAAGRVWPYSFVNSGVPHVVIRVDAIDELDVGRAGAAIRRHPDFQPAGTNVNFIEIVGPDRLRIRTFERGVESETWACGTGIVAAVLVAARSGWARPPVRVDTARGFTLFVDFSVAGDEVRDVTLEGPAAYVFRGCLWYPDVGVGLKAPEGSAGI